MRGQTTSIRRANTRRKGFTYVDAVVTIFIMGIAAAIAAPRLSTAYSQHQLRSATARFAADLSYLRQQAITKGRSLTVTIDTASQELSCSEVRSVEHSHESFSAVLTDFVQGAKMTLQTLSPVSSSRSNFYSFDFSRDGLTLDPRGVQKPNWRIRIQHSNTVGVVEVTDAGVTWKVES